LTVALDATYSIGREPSGVGVYSCELIREVASVHPETTLLLGYRPHRFFSAFGTRIPANCRRRPLWEERPIRSASLFHGLNQRLPRAHYRRRVCTFHDLFVLTGDYSTPEFRERFARHAREAAGRADLIVCVSEFTASQVSGLLGVESSRIRVIRHGVRLPSTPVSGSRERIVLHVGAIQRRKNVARLVRAFESALPGWQLVLAGSAGFGAEEALDAVARSPRRADIRVLGYVAAPALDDLYRRASILAFPSLDEGFGIPVLEAMAWGVPVITSAGSALREVAGDAAVLVDPTNDDELRTALKAVASDSSLARSLADRGRSRAAEFTWRRAALSTWGVYRELGFPE
jgi:glycosyltransferase involved in cell wall biosynthesis